MTSIEGFREEPEVTSQLHRDAHSGGGGGGPHLRGKSFFGNIFGNIFGGNGAGNGNGSTRGPTFASLPPATRVQLAVMVALFCMLLIDVPRDVEGKRGGVHIPDDLTDVADGGEAWSLTSLICFQLYVRHCRSSA